MILASQVDIFIRLFFKENILFYHNKLNLRTRINVPFRIYKTPVLPIIKKEEIIFNWQNTLLFGQFTGEVRDVGTTGVNY